MRTGLYLTRPPPVVIRFTFGATLGYCAHHQLKSSCSCGFLHLARFWTSRKENQKRDVGRLRKRLK